MIAAMRHCSKGHLAHWALKWLLAGVGSNMILQLAQLGIALVTIRARIWLFTSMSPHVHFQFTQQGKFPWAFLTMKRGVASVNFHMLLQ
jgi:hypothetical protein